jgi:raffinose/stachyose/melibiose transport system substrate-binding protein
VLLGTMAPQAAADRLEQGLKGWYAPHQGQQAKAVDCQCTAPAAVSAAPATVEASVATSSAAISTALSASPVSAAVAPSAAASTDVEQALASELEAPQP